MKITHLDPNEQGIHQTDSTKVSQSYIVEDFQYVPLFYTDRRVSRVKRYVNVLLEAFKNGFGKPIHYRSEKSIMDFELGRGDTNHRAGELISPQEHNILINDSYTGYQNFRARINSKNTNSLVLK